MVARGEGRAIGKMREEDLEVQTSSYQISKSQDVMCSRATLVSSTVLHIGELLREGILTTVIRGKKSVNLYGVR